MGEAENIALIRRFLDACPRADADEMASFFTEDAIWWNAPWPAAEGREAIKEQIRRGSTTMESLPWEVRHIVADGDVVMTERVDHFRVGDTRISVPCMGTFELRDGLIHAWRDYFDLQQFQRQLPGHRESPA